MLATPCPWTGIPPPCNCLPPGPCLPRPQELLLLGADDTVPIELAGGGGSELLTLARVQAAPGGGPRVAPIGLPDMLNAGGAVVR